jgi:uncharacterized protein (TIGR03435 family)
MAALALGAIPSLCAQTPSPVPAFEVATIKPSSPDAPGSDLNISASEFGTKNVALNEVIKFAYNLNDGSDEQIIGGPSWLRTSRFDIQTKLDEATRAQVVKMTIDDQIAVARPMAQALLADHFHLKVHHETRFLPVIALTLAHPEVAADTKLTQVPDPLKSPNPSHEWSGLRNDGQGHVEVRGETITDFAEFLGHLPEIGGRVVIDQTGLTGDYAFTLNYAPQRLAETNVEDGSSDPSHASLFAALTEQLGLKLKSIKAPIDVIVIDHVDLPTPN